MIRTLDEHLEHNFARKIKEIPNILREYQHDGFQTFEKSMDCTQKDILSDNVKLNDAIYELLTNENIALLNKSRDRVLSNKANDDILVECYIMKKLVEFVHTNHKELSGIEITVSNSYFDQNIEGLIELFNKSDFHKYEMVQIFCKQQWKNEATSSVPYNSSAINKKIESIYLEKYKNSYDNNKKSDSDMIKKKKKRKLRSLF